MLHFQTFLGHVKHVRCEQTGGPQGRPHAASLIHAEQSMTLSFLSNAYLISTLKSKVTD